MKKLMALVLGLSCMLAGCANKTDTDVSGSSEAETTTVEETTAETTDAEEETTTEEATEAETTEPETEEATEAPEDNPISARDNLIARYKEAIESKIDYVSSELDPDRLYVSYTLLDVCHRGTPELLVKYGTGEINYVIAIYTIDENGGLMTKLDGLSGSHTGFAVDLESNELVLASGHMNSGCFEWYTSDEVNNVFPTPDKARLVFEYSADSKTFEDFMVENKVAYLDVTEFIGNKTVITRSSAQGETVTEEYDGYDYRYLENYAY